MTPKEKAQELILKYLRIETTNEWWSKVPAKECALIAVVEIIKEKKGCSKYECYGQDINWSKVKKELENL